MDARLRAARMEDSRVRVVMATVMSFLLLAARAASWERKAGTMNLMCGGKSFRVAFLDTHAAVIRYARARMAFQVRAIAGSRA